MMPHVYSLAGTDTARTLEAFSAAYRFNIHRCATLVELRRALDKSGSAGNIVIAELRSLVTEDISPAAALGR